MSKQYGAFDEVNIGASLALSFGDQTVQTSASVDAHRIARSTFSVGQFPGQVEAIVYSPDGSNPSLVSVAGVPPCAIGIVLATDSLAKYVGEDTTGSLAAPAAPVPTTAATGGTILAGTYQVVLTYINPNGETVGSTAGPITTTGSTSTITIPSPAASGNATAYYAYVSQAGGTAAAATRQQAAGSPTAIGTALTLTAPPTNTGATSPAANTTGTNGYGYCPGDGKVYHAGGVLATIGTATFGDYVSVVVDPVGGTLQFNKNGGPLGAAISIPKGLTWYYAATVSGAAGSMALYVNAGKTPIRYQSVGNIGGWWKTSATINPVLLSTEPYITKSTDSLANTKFNGDIDQKTQPLRIKRSVQFWPWGQSMPSDLSKSINPLGSQTTQISMRVLDPNGIYNQLLTSDVRDISMPIYRLAQGGSFDTAEQSFLGIVDAVHADTDQTKIIYLTDAISQLQQPLNRALYPPNVDKSVAGKPRDISLGPCRNYIPSLFDTTNNLYGAHDTNLSALGILRIAGKPESQGTTGTTYSILPDASGFKQSTATGLKFTAESTSTGAAYNPGGTDILSGTGNFLTATPDANNNPTGWQCTQTGFPALNTIWQVDATLGVKTPNNVDQFAAIGETMYTLASGFSYVVQIQVTAVPFSGTSSGQVISPATLTCGIWLGSTLSPFGLSPGDATNNKSLTATGTYTFTINNNTGVAANFAVLLLCNNGNIGQFAMSSVKVQQLPNVTDNVALTPLTLSQILKAVILDRGPLDPSQLSTTESDAIDTATGYGYGIHIRPTEQPTVQQVVKQIMDCVCGDIYQGRDGKIHAVRLIAPESVASGSVTGSLSVTDFNGYLTPHPDNAENLSTRLQGCRNWDPYSSGDFASSTLTDVPLADRAKLMQAYQWTAVAGIQLSPKYAYAASASPLPTLFDLIAHGQAEAARVNAIYASPRNFYVGEVFTEIGRKLEIGDVWNVVYPIGSLTAGQQLLVVGVEEQPSEALTKAVFWGL